MTLQEQAFKIAMENCGQAERMAQVKQFIDDAVAEGIDRGDASNMAELAIRLFLGFITNVSLNTHQHPADYQEKCLQFSKNVAYFLIDSFIVGHVFTKAEEAAAALAVSTQAPV